jgi:hypothetical protein
MTEMGYRLMCAGNAMIITDANSSGEDIDRGVKTKQKNQV